MAENNPGGFSPEVLAWIMGLGPNPFAVYEDANSQVVGNWDLPADLDDVGTMDLQNDRLTAQNKANDQYSDFAQIAQLGSGTGGFSPEMFKPFVTYEPVQAPGYQRMAYYSNSSDPAMSYAAKRLQEGATSFQVETEMRNIAAQDATFAAALPVYEDEVQGPLTDWKRVGSLLDGLEKDIIADPAFNAFDPSTSLPANEVVNQTEAAKWFAERDLPNPYETYDPDLLASRDTLSLEQKNRDRAGGIRSERDATLLEAQRNPLNPPKSQAGYPAASTPFPPTLAAPLQRQGPPTQTTFTSRDPATGEVLSLTDRLAPKPGPLVDGRAQSWSDSSGPQPLRGHASGPGGRGGAKVSGALMRAMLDQGATSRGSAAGRAAFEAQSNYNKQRVREEDDGYAQLERQAMMRALTKMGHTPFNDVNRARQGNVYGF